MCQLFMGNITMLVNGRLHQTLCINMNKNEYIDRLLLASNHARELAMSLEYVNVSSPKQYCYS